jgi:Tropinone reductase 1
VLTCARNAKDMEELLAACRKAGWHVEGMLADVSVPQDRKKLVAKAVELFDGKLGGCLCNE